MSIAVEPMTIDEFLALPESDKVERWLVDGRLKEFRMSKRGPVHARVSANVTSALHSWARQHPKPRPGVYCGDIYFLLQKSPDRSVGIDVAVIEGPRFAALADDAQLIDGPPLLAVEIISPSDRASRVQKKIDLYRGSGTPLTWLVNPFGQTVTVYRPQVDAVLFTRSMQITAMPELPGFGVAVAELFE
jgi:Uma2 family endonuclease